ncbi:hypothetical protein [Pontixanthobacter gangjinensis]|uniref:Transporter n=1 Tax=Pontixanthobacter gangjinensis TaxID=1028742 RepID=A0A6I4SPD0_9SPHN|nr:hypothetical protein [Pontixanthobacter gangjinensis]MXO57643.1 hypothetical protein [Pontixanthobacter gangjinensis]
MRKYFLSQTSIIALAALAAGYPAIAAAQDIAETADTSEIQALRDQVAELEARDAAARERVEALESRLLRLERIEAEPISLDDSASMRGRFAAQQSFARPSDPAFRAFPTSSGLVAMQDPPDGGAGADTTSDLKAPAPTAAQEDVTEQQQGAFGRNIGVELAMSYTHFDNARINLDGFLALDAIFLGSISVDRINADIFTLEPRVNIGLSDRLFVDASVPLLSRISNFQSGGAGGSAAGLVEKTVRGTGIGDASFGLSYRVMPESVTAPDVVINTRVKFPTGRDPFGIEFIEVEGSEGNLSIPSELSFGTGVYGASLGVSLLKTLDPMIVFGSATYFHNFKRSFDDIDEIPGDQPGRVKLGDAYQIGAGLAFALNDKSSISMSYTQRIVERTRLTPLDQDTRIVVGSQANVSLLNLGATFSLGENIAIVTNAGIGLTDDSPDMAISVRIPYRF